MALPISRTPETSKTSIAWDECLQIPLGKMTWTQAVKIAKMQEFGQVRLSVSKGFNNQGHYIQCENPF